MPEKKEVVIYTDGACSGNPGPGGYGVVLLFGHHRKEISGGRKNTTNNRMELMAAIEGLRCLKTPCKVTLFSDSQYMVQSIRQRWVYKWQAQGWMRNKKEHALNVDLWKQLIPLLEKHDVDFRWTRGHAGNSENERCDVLAVTASQRPDLPEDTTGS
jgi:ribonuclease HI